MPAIVSTRPEIGGTGGGPGFQEDYNPALRGERALQTYDRMRRSDAQVRATLRLIKTPIVSAQWFVQPASNDPYDRLVAEFVEWNMHAMSRTWDQFILEALASLDFGSYVFERVYERARWKSAERAAKPREVVKWKKLAPRHPMTIEDWKFDDNGGVKGVKHTKTDSSGASKTVDIPISRLLVFTYEEEGGNPEGTSVLRSAYKHWYYKEQLYKFDAIQKERHSIGIPKAKLPPNADEKDRKFAREMLANLRTNEQAYIIEPFEWEVSFVELISRTGPVEPLESAKHHDVMIARNVIAQFLSAGSSEVGNRSMVAAAQDLFIKSLRAVGDWVSGVVNQYAVRPLVDLNFKVDNYPVIKVRRIGDEADWRAFSVAMRNLAAAGLITADDETEAWLRDRMDLIVTPKDFNEEERALIGKGKGGRQ